jgi:hypothetical protein
MPVINFDRMLVANSSTDYNQGRNGCLEGACHASS